MVSELILNKGRSEILFHDSRSFTHNVNIAK
jgi:hypothetical protein